MRPAFRTGALLAALLAATHSTAARAAGFFASPKTAIFVVATEADPDVPFPSGFIGFKLVNHTDFAILDNGAGVRVAYGSATVQDKLIVAANKFGAAIECDGVVAYTGAQYFAAENRPNEAIVSKVGKCRPAPEGSLP